MGTTVNPDIIGYVWTGDKFDLNMVCVDGEIFESGKKKLRIQKYPNECGRGLSGIWNLFNEKEFKNIVSIAGERAGV